MGGATALRLIRVVTSNKIRRYALPGDRRTRPGSSRANWRGRTTGRSRSVGSDRRCYEDVWSRGGHRGVALWNFNRRRESDPGSARKNRPRAGTGGVAPDRALAAEQGEAPQSLRDVPCIGQRTTRGCDPRKDEGRAADASARPVERVG